MAPTLSPRSKQRLIDAIDKAGIGKPVRAAHRAMSPIARRNVLDDRQLTCLIAHSLAPDSNCVDVGAHDGLVLEELLRVAPEGRHLAVEPIPEKAEALARAFPQVDVHNAALSDKRGTATFTHYLVNPQLSGLRDRTSVGDQESEQIEVELFTLDDLLDSELPIALIKIDVEGAELGVLRGAIRTLKRWKPIVVFEHGVGGADQFGVGPGDVYDFLTGEAGMRIFDIDGAGPYTRPEFVAVFTEPMWFFVAHE